MEDGALTDCVARGPPDSQVYGDIWTVVSTDFKEKEAPHRADRVHRTAISNNPNMGFSKFLFVL